MRYANTWINTMESKRTEIANSTYYSVRYEKERETMVITGKLLFTTEVRIKTNNGFHLTNGQADTAHNEIINKFTYDIYGGIRRELIEILSAFYATTGGLVPYDSVVTMRIRQLIKALETTSSTG